ncbi:MAG TPA: (5-formylfuran-3-yl)methyl phosphate synthase [Gemmatimonadales bacterium]|nr:(5-formylfuran-3-yl)methyl phosphate synthase [Gemmatimonadales bacterium]
MQLLVSVLDAREARAALTGGADVIDAKDPGQGALGRLSPATLASICAAVAGARPVSAALGDATEGTAAAARCAPSDLRFVKLGFGGVTDEARAARLALTTRQAAALTGLVLVAYADWRRAQSLEPARVIAVAERIGAEGVLVDTAHKDRALFELVSPDRVAAMVHTVHGAGMFAALAGSLTERDFGTARALGAELVGVRGAACVGGRTGRVSPARVARLAALASPAPRLRVGAFA